MRQVLVHFILDIIVASVLLFLYEIMNVFMLFGHYTERVRAALPTFYAYIKSTYVNNDKKLHYYDYLFIEQTLKNVFIQQSYLHSLR